MNKLTTYIGTTPTDGNDECAHFVIDDINAPFILHDILDIGNTYTLSLWIRSDANGIFRVFNKSLNTDNTWIRYVITFEANEKHLPFVFDANGNYYIYHPQLERGVVATDYRIATEDIESGVVDDIDFYLNEMKTNITTSYTSMINQTKSEIEQSVQSLTESITGNTDTITRLESSLNLTDKQLSYIKETTQTLEDVVNGKVDASTIREWAVFDGAKLELGITNSDFKTILTNTELGFYQGTEKVAWISNQELNVLRAIISQSIGVGKLRLVDETETLGVYSFLVI